MKTAVFGLMLAGGCASQGLAADFDATSKVLTDWTGWNVGSQLGYIAGKSNFSLAAPGAPPTLGVIDLTQPISAFKGTGPYAIGLSAGYDHMFPSRAVIGFEGDLSFPNVISGTTPIATAQGTGTLQKHVQMMGTLRARLGYSSGPWLFYATGGLALSSDQFALGLSDGANGGSGTLTRLGTVWGVGAEFVLSENWSARFEFLASTFGTVDKTVSSDAQRFSSDLAFQTTRLGVNYHFDKVGSQAFREGLKPFEASQFSLRGQTTYLQQYAAPFRSPYTGTNSLRPDQTRETWDLTLYGGYQPWKGGEFWINPEIDQGFGLSSTLGVAGFPSGEAYKVGSATPYARIPRAFFRQTINLGGDTRKVDSDLNQFAATQTTDRIVFTAGKFAVTDVFDTNRYAHDPRKDFMNWSIVDTGTFDYAADAWGYTYGGALEWYTGAWTFRGGLFDLSKVPNSAELDPTFSQFQWVAEIERRYYLLGKPGKLAVTGFVTRGRMGRFDEAVSLARLTSVAADTALVRRYQSRSGISVNLEQEITPDLGLFARAGIADGSKESYEFTDIDATIAAGLLLAGSTWNRPNDTFGIAGVVNGISQARRAYLGAGGLGILVGDGRLPNAGAETIIETNYSFPVWSWRATLDYQLVVNPAYNRDRGPASIFGVRMRSQF